MYVVFFKFSNFFKYEILVFRIFFYFLCILIKKSGFLKKKGIDYLIKFDHNYSALSRF